MRIFGMILAIVGAGPILVGLLMADIGPGDKAFSAALALDGLIVVVGLIIVTIGKQEKARNKGGRV